MNTGGGTAESTTHVPDLPEGWHVVTVDGPLGFVTRVTLRDPDGSDYRWTSRGHRKLLGIRTAGQRDAASRRSRPSPISRWLGTLFGVGSICFAVGSLPLFFNAVDASIAAWTFFVGSLFFTSAAALQLHETVAAPTTILGAPRFPRLSSTLRWRPHRIDWWAAAVQLVGTVAFNVSTFAATRADLSVEREARLIWTPDVVGSICFLVASWLAYAEVNRGVLPRPDRATGWRIASVNLLGSLAFGAAAVAARYLPTTNEPANIALVNLGTFAGAVCFLAGAVLLPVESARDSRTDGPTS